MMRLKYICGVALLTSAAFFAANSWAGSVPLLEGTEWGPENGLGQYIQFKEGGEVFGFAGCNTFLGTYSQSGDRLTLGELSITEQECDGMMGAEAAFLDGLKGSHRLDVVNNDIRVYNQTGRWILGLRQRF